MRRFSNRPVLRADSRASDRFTTRGRDRPGPGLSRHRGPRPPAPCPCRPKASGDLRGRSPAGPAWPRASPAAAAHSGRAAALPGVNAMPDLAILLRALEQATERLRRFRRLPVFTRGLMTGMSSLRAAPEGMRAVGRADRRPVGPARPVRLRQTWPRALPAARIAGACPALARRCRQTPFPVCPAYAARDRQAKPRSRCSAAGMRGELAKRLEQQR